ncbi:MAG TPA: hypothetical protein VIL90_07380 [Puia sp.]
MKIKPNLFSLSRNPDSLLFAAMGFILILIFSKHSGIGVSPDSVTYLAAARHMISGTGFRSFDNMPVVDFPFAYPFFLTVLSFITRVDPLQYGPWLNGFLFSVLIYICGSIMNGFQKSNGWYKRIILLCILLSPALQEVYSMLWSETVFLILIFFFIFSITNYLKYSSNKWLLVSAAICAVTCLTRYAGVSVMLTGGVITFFNRENPWPRRIMDCLVFGVLSVPLLVINVIRNLWLTGLATGLRPKSEVGLVKIMEYFGGVLCDWLLLKRSTGLAVLMTAMVLLLFAFIILIRQTKKTASGLEYVIAVTGFIYCAFMLFSYSVTRYEPFTSRLVSPAFIPLLWSLSSWIPGYMEKKSYPMKWVIGVPAFMLAAWFLNRELAADWEYYDGVKDAGIPGYREDPFMKSEIVQFLDKNKKSFDPRFPIYSNAGDAVYFITGLPARQLPFNDFPKKVQAYYTGSNDHRPEYLVWFQSEEDSQMPGLAVILKNKEMVLVKQLPDGAVYVSK